MTIIRNGKEEQRHARRRRNAARPPREAERAANSAADPRARTVARAGGQGQRCRRPGVVVTKVDPDGPAAERGFKVGDVILDVGGAKVGNPAEVRKAIADARSGGKRTVLMRVKSGEQTRFVAIPVGNAKPRADRMRSAVGICRPRLRRILGDGPCARPHFFEV